MGFLDKPIAVGSWAGLTTGLYKHFGSLPPEAQKLLDELPRHPSSWKEEGIIKGLMDLGLVERRGFLWWANYYPKA